MSTLSVSGILMALGLAAMIPPHTPIVADTAVREVTAAEAARAEAKQHGDGDQLEGLLAPDFIKINRFGRLLGKRSTIALARNPTYATTDAQLRIYDNAAVVTGRESDESEPPGSVRFLRVWIRDGDRWREWADEGTRIASEPEAARLAKERSSTVDRSVVETGSETNHVREAAEAPADVAQDVRRAERSYRDAERVNDIVTLSKFRAPEFRLVDRLGKVHTSPPSVSPTIKAVHDEDFSVRVHGNLAIVIGSVLRTNLGNGATDRLRHSAVWVHSDAQWRVVAEQQTPIP